MTQTDKILGLIPEIISVKTIQKITSKFSKAKIPKTKTKSFSQSNKKNKKV